MPHIPARGDGHPIPRRTGPWVKVSQAPLWKSLLRLYVSVFPLAGGFLWLTWEMLAGQRAFFIGLVGGVIGLLTLLTIAAGYRQLDK